VRRRREELDASMTTDSRAVGWTGWDTLLSLVVGAVSGSVGSVLLVMLIGILHVDVPSSAVLAFVGTTVYVAMAMSVRFFCLRRHALPWTALGLRRVPAGTLVAMAPLAVGLFVANGVITLLLISLFGHFHNPQGELLAPDGLLSAPDFLILLLLVAVVAPVGEELVFRGLLYRYFRAKAGVPIAVISSAALFATAHGIPQLMPSLAVMGVALALVAERYDSIFPPVALHALYNALTLTVLWAALGG
jgi:uncharacterized protein